jgi:hypothetical protein
MSEIKTRYFSEIMNGTVNLNISQDCVHRCYNDDRHIDIIDLLILDYIHSRPIYIGNGTVDVIPLLYTQCYNKLYFELSFEEFETYYKCAEDIIWESAFYDRVYELEEMKLLERIMLSENKDGFRTTALYDEIILGM